MVKEYQVRKHDEKHPICECGHADFDHNIWKIDGECKTCMCPKFIKEQELTMEQYAKLQLVRMGWPLSKI